PSRRLRGSVTRATGPSGPVAVSAVGCAIFRRRRGSDGVEIRYHTRLSFLSLSSHPLVWSMSHMGRYKFAVVSGVCLSAALAACSNSPKSPVSPDTSAPIVEAVGPAGETLKIAAPATLSPSGGVQADAALVLVAGNVAGTHATFPVSYRYEVRKPGGAVVATGIVPAAAGNSTSIPVSTALDFDADHTWRVRAEYAGAAGPWSGDAAFRSSAGGYIKGSEVFD